MKEIEKAKALCGFWTFASIIILICLVFHPALAEVETEKSEVAPTETQVHVTLATLREGTLPTTLQALGKIHVPRQTPASIMALAPGVVTKLLVRDGERVTAGAVLLRLDGRATQAELRKARSGLALAQKELQYAGETGLVQTAAELDLTAHQAEVRATQARQDNERQSKLLAKSLVSEKAANEARQAAEASRREAAAAEKKAADFRRTGKGMELERLRAKVEEARAAVGLAEIEAEATTVRAPLSGRVTRVHTAIGQTVEKGGLLVELQADQELGAVFSLTPQQTTQVRPGMAFALADTQTTRTYAGVITAVGAGVDGETGLVPVEGKIEGKGAPAPYLGEILPGVIITGASPKGMVVPLGALSVTDDGTVLHQVDVHHQAHVVKVEVLARNAQEAVVRAEGLKADQQVIADGNYHLPDGATIVAEARP